MPRRIRVLLLFLLLLLLHLAALLPGSSSSISGSRRAAGAGGTGRVKKKIARIRSCLDPPEETLEQMFGRLSVGVMSAFHHALQLEPQDKQNRSCPSSGRSPGHSKSRLPVNLLSISPWAYRISYDPTRYPRSVPEAYCLCKGCLLGASGQESLRFRSAPVYAPSVILKRTGSCVAGRHSYTEVYVSVAVGCTCVPLLDKERDGRRSNQSLDRSEGKTGHVMTTRKKV